MGGRKKTLADAALILGLGCSLVLLLLHSAHFLFLTDDAYISFRYATNLATGEGLVFNPGGEAVEGYTNFLWVVLLAGLSWIGFSIPDAASTVSLLLTIVLWGLVLWYTHIFPPVGRRWLTLIPLLFLAVTRSIAVWASGGLETRLFEVLVIAGLLRGVVEVQAVSRGGRRRPWSALLLSLATLARPDGLLLGVVAFAVVSGAARRVRYLVQWLALFMSPVAGHLAFRMLYYGDPLPNTFYAKVVPGGWAEMGWCYLAAFLLEYAAYLWVPLLLLGVALHLRRGRAWVPLLLTGPLVAHAAYVVYIGGDHFEYRVLDLYLPLIFMLLYDGARLLVRRSALAAVGLCGLVAVGLVALPLQTHRQFPRSPPSGFPGSSAFAFPRVEEDLIYSLPGLRWIHGAYAERLRRMTRQFVGLRQESHAAFVRHPRAEGDRLRRMVELGLLPPDAHVAVECVGALPYLSRLKTMDRLGLTEAHVARARREVPPEKRLMAHDRRATLAHARAKGVDLWSVHPYLLLTRYERYDVGWIGMVEGSLAHPVHAASLGGGWLLVAVLPQGIAHARRRFPELSFFDATDYLALRLAMHRDAKLPDPFAGLEPEGK